uniref:Uncharacterized protein n=1 Tax=viral metagenome TaxID=1070528 RepID=A0A6C0CL29_9ZZZZ
MMHRLEFRWYRRESGSFSAALVRKTMQSIESVCGAAIGYGVYRSDLRKDMRSAYHSDGRHSAVSHSVSHICLMNKTEQVSGVALIRSGRGADVWYLELIGAKKGLGGHVLQHIHKQAIKHGVRMINIAALPTKICWYYLHGYRFGFDGTQPQILTKLIQPIFEYQKAHPEARYQTLEDIFSDPDKRMRNLLEMTVRFRLATNNKKRKLEDAVIDGVYMTIYF